MFGPLSPTISNPIYLFVPDDLKNSSFSRSPHPTSNIILLLFPFTSLTKSWNCGCSP